MKIVRPSSENEMISEFLKAEYASERFSQKVRTVLSEGGFSSEIILSPDLGNDLQNALRKNILKRFRGYGENREMFERFPAVTAYYSCLFSKEDLPDIRYIDYDYWNELSNGTHSPLIAAETIRSGKQIFGIGNEGFLTAAAYVKEHGFFPKMFFLTSDLKRFVIVEGHLRMTAYALESTYFNDIEILVGKCEETALKKWM